MMQSINELTVFVSSREGLWWEEMRVGSLCCVVVVVKKENRQKLLEALELARLD